METTEEERRSRRRPPAKMFAQFDSVRRDARRCTCMICSSAAAADAPALNTQEEVSLSEFRRRAPPPDLSSFLLNRAGRVCPVSRKVMFIKEGCGPARCLHGLRQAMLRADMIVPARMPLRATSVALLTSLCGGWCGQVLQAVRGAWRDRGGAAVDISSAEARAAAAPDQPARRERPRRARQDEARCARMPAALQQARIQACGAHKCMGAEPWQGMLASGCYQTLICVCRPGGSLQGG